LNDFFKIGEIDEDDFIDAEATEEVETLAGFILELKGEIPRKDERIEFGEKYLFEVLSVDNRRIKKVKLIIKEEQEDEEA
jgi:CBS domain containing-hemolysin-like protein